MSVFTFLSLSGASVQKFATLHRPWFRLTERKNRHSRCPPEQIQAGRVNTGEYHGVPLRKQLENEIAQENRPLVFLIALDS